MSPCLISEDFGFEFAQLKFKTLTKQNNAIEINLIYIFLQFYSKY